MQNLQRAGLDLWMILNVEFWGIWKEAIVTSFSTGIRLEKIKKIKIDSNFQH
jgi:hypothetical protein